MLNTSTIIKNITNDYGTYENEKNNKYNGVRLTAAQVPEIEEPRFDFDALTDDNEIEEACDLLLPNITRCHGDDSESFSYLTCCICGFKECEYYGYCYKSSTYCNECALEVCGKLIENPKLSFNSLQVEEEIDHSEFFQCQVCFFETKWEDKVCLDDKWFCNGCAHDMELMSKYSAEQCEQLRLYAAKHNITLEEAIDYQTHCHCCGKTVDDGMFDEMNHQYCTARCFEHCEDYWYECDRGKDCKVCGIWECRARRDSLTAYDIELSNCEPVLAAIDCFKELNVYNQCYECIEDIVDYFGTDSYLRYDFV
jgi:hypothetical protein